MSLSTFVPGLCQQTTVNVRGAGLTLTLVYRPKWRKRQLRFLKSARLHFSFFLLLHPPVCFSVFLPSFSSKACRCVAMRKKTGSGPPTLVSIRDMPEKQRPLNCTNTTAEKQQQGPPMEVASERPRPKPASWISVLLDKDMHERIKCHIEMHHKNC